MKWFNGSLWNFEGHVTHLDRHMWKQKVTMNFGWCVASILGWMVFYCIYASSFNIHVEICTRMDVFFKSTLPFHFRNVDFIVVTFPHTSLESQREMCLHNFWIVSTVVQILTHHKYLYSIFHSIKFVWYFFFFFV